MMRPARRDRKPANGAARAGRFRSRGRRSALVGQGPIHVPVRTGSATTASPAPSGSGWEVGALVTLTLLLLGFGLVSLYSGSSVLAMERGLPADHFFVSQTAGALVGISFLAVCAFVPPRFWRAAAIPALLLTLIALLIVVLPQTHAIAPEIKGARRWLRIGPVTGQPSELAKLVIVIWTASAVTRRASRLNSLARGILPLLIVWGVVASLIVLERDLSTAVLVIGLGLAVAFAAGVRLKHCVGMAIVTIPILLHQLNVGFRKQRITAFVDPTADPSGSSYQVNQSLLAMGSGGFGGVGFGEGRQKFGFLPEPHNDFAVALIGEEWGFLGVLGVTLAFLGLTVTGFKVAGKARTSFERLMVIGFTTMIAVHAFLHMAVSLALVPTTGLSMPFISYGRSNLVAMLIAVGIIVAVARRSRAAPIDREGRPSPARRAQQARPLLSRGGHA
ncbi:MAG: FtsW/RodA/SpoVE family cell cycle protein [Gemmatimonadetes bacterium]|nr:FtsW/RodA/SpoVE family cell cycle protein [Gemmatimonadota bacterium]